MGVPSLYRWLGRKYPLINQNAYEEKPIYHGSKKEVVDISRPNPNNVEFDNLYLDMNGIIHPCTHPENKPAPKNFDEMMVEIFAYIDRILSISRPRKLIYMAIDGVAPRAKMNQQRSRRFRSAQEMEFKKNEIDKIKERLLERGLVKNEESKEKVESFDSNCITPGTVFMDQLSTALKFYICDKFSNCEAWKDLVVILSDSNVPGEGEHKIMEYIRHQRAQKGYDPNTKHILHGADADLIMLGLGTHETYFTVLREVFKPRKSKPCEICKRYGHEMKNCDGIIEEEEKLTAPAVPTEYDDTSFVFIRIYVLRMYLTKIFKNCFNKPDVERHIDDWIFIIFFVGNDFLPHLPSLEINENAIDRLFDIYTRQFLRTKQYLTDSGIVNFKEVESLLRALGNHEDQIFRERYDKDQKMKERSLREEFVSLQKDQSKSFGLNLESFLSEENTTKNETKDTSIQQTENNDTKNEDEINDTIQFHKEGWKMRYYSEKFGVDEEIGEFSQDVAYHYCRGLSWVLQYYFRGCPNWKWFYQFHYSPFASDFENIAKIKNNFKPDSQPFKPFEQLMGVFPAASRNFLPEVYHHLMTEPNSPIIHFYPTNFRIDLNGKKWAWQGVALLPFVSEKELLDQTSKIESKLSDEEKKRNRKGYSQIFCSKSSALGKKILSNEEKLDSKEGLYVEISKDIFIAGKFKSPEDPQPERNFKSIVKNMPDLLINTALCCDFEDPEFPKGHMFTAKMLPGTQMPVDIVGNQMKKRTHDSSRNQNSDFSGQKRNKLDNSQQNSSQNSSSFPTDPRTHHQNQFYPQPHANNQFYAPNNSSYTPFNGEYYPAPGHNQYYQPPVSPHGHYYPPVTGYNPQFSPEINHQMYHPPDSQFPQYQQMPPSHMPSMNSSLGSQRSYASHQSNSKNSNHNNSGNKQQNNKYNYRRQK